ncbi:MAG: tRNA pseudouridine(38-40) synthase TruA [Candidatus Omnitrophota bacterium]
MRNVRIDLEYDGRNYCGWQWQPNLPTIEGAVKQAAETMLQHSITLYSCGRTDAGVHAEQHVAHFHTEVRLPAHVVFRALNSLLPPDIAVHRVLDMPLDWSARHDALEREYRYRFYRSQTPSVFWRGRSLWIERQLDVDAMREAAGRLVGKHDFSAFRSLHCDAESPVRRVLEIAFEENPPLIDMRVRGHAFLRHQVRTFAGTLLFVGLGKWPPSKVEDILASKDRAQAGPTLEPHGLTLAAVRYEGDEERFAAQEWLLRE